MSSPQPGRRVYEFGPFRLDPSARLLLNSGQVVPLGSKAFDILLMLVENAGKPFEKEALIRAVWPDTFVEESNLTHQIAVLRKALGAAPGGRTYIETLPKRGYQFVGYLNVSWTEGLARISAAGAATPQLVSPQPTKLHGRRLAVAGAMLVAGAVLTIVSSSSLLRRRDRPVSNFTFTQLTDQPGQKLYPSLSPDGRAFVYASRASGNWDIYVQRVGGKNHVNLTKDSPADDTQPTFSPDGQFIAFRSDRDGGGIFVMGATGESAKRVSESGYHPSWSPNGKEIVYSTTTYYERPDVRIGSRGQLRIVDVSTGRTRSLRVRIEDAVQPHWSPHGYRIAYWGSQPTSRRDIWTVSAMTGSEASDQPAVATNDAHLDWNPVWSPDGRYLYFSSDRRGSVNLWRVAIDERSGKLLGVPEPITTPSPYSGYISFSRDGQRITYVQQFRTSNLYKLRFDPVAERTMGQPMAVTQGSREAYFPDLSPDGRVLAFATFGQQEDIFTVGSDGTGLRNLTNDAYKDRAPHWSADGKQIAFMSNRNGKFEIWTIHPDGAALQQLTWYPTRAMMCPVWSPDGTRLAATPTGANSFIMGVHTPWKQQALQTLPPLPKPNESFSVWTWSPDGRQLAGERVGAGGAMSGISIYSLESQKYQHLTDFGGRPHWLSDSRRLVFVHQGKIYLIDSRSRRVREALSVAPHEIQSYNLAVSQDDRLIYFSIENSEADVWMMNAEG